MPLISEKKWEQFISGKQLYKIAISKDTIYASSGKEIYFFSIRNHQTGKLFIDNLKNNIGIHIVTSLYTDYQQNIWAGDEKGNVFYKSTNENIFRYRRNINAGGITETDYPVYCFYADELGTLWVGADVLGLLRATVNPSGFHSYPAANEKKKITNFFVTCIYEDKNDKVWLGTFQKGLMLLDKKTGKTKGISLPGMPLQQTSENIIGFIKTDSSQNLWIGTAGYLYVKEKGATLFKVLKIPLPQNTLALKVQTSSFTSCKNGWLMGTTLGLYFIHKKEGNYIFNYLREFGQSRISDIWVDNKYGIWIGFESQSLFIIKDMNHIKDRTELFTETGIKSFLYDEPYQLLWICTQSGFIAYHLPTGKYKNFTEADGLGNSYVYGALKNNNDLWLSTNRGLSKATVNFKKNDVLPKLSFTNFTSNDGLPDDEFNTGAFYKGNSGNFYFGTIKGCVWFKPDKINPNYYLPKIVMTDILVNEAMADSSTSPGYIRQLSLPYFKNSLFFRFRGIEYSNSSKVNYAFKLDGSDKDWVFSGTLNEVRYNNLPHGDYLFKVKAANAAAVWNEEAYTVMVIINPPFWKTWWFYLLATVIGLAIIILITKTITGRKLKKEIEKLERQKTLVEERHRISQEMHDDIGAGLTQITLMSESAKENKTTAKLDDIANTCRQLVGSMSEIIWSMNPENKTLAQLFAYLREQLNKQLEYSGMAYNVELPENGNEIILTNQQRRNILLITKEIVNNAIKYSGAKIILVKAELTNECLLFIIRDGGTGFDSHKICSGNGLTNIQNRIKLLGGTFKITSSSEGTDINYEIPLQ